MKVSFSTHSFSLNRSKSILSTMASFTRSVTPQAIKGEANSSGLDFYKEEADFALISRKDQVEERFAKNLEFIYKRSVEDAVYHEQSIMMMQIYEKVCCKTSEIFEKLSGYARTCADDANKPMSPTKLTKQDGSESKLHKFFDTPSKKTAIHQSFDSIDSELTEFLKYEEFSKVPN